MKMYTDDLRATADFIEKIVAAEINAQGYLSLDTPSEFFYEGENLGLIGRDDDGDLYFEPRAS